jgi:hypothetical protein
MDVPRSIGRAIRPAAALLPWFLDGHVDHRGANTIEIERLPSRRLRCPVGYAELLSAIDDPDVTCRAPNGSVLPDNLDENGIASSGNNAPGAAVIASPRCF